MEALLLFTKVLLAVIAIPALVFGIIIGARWWKEPTRSIKVGFLGISIHLGEGENKD